MVYSPLCPVDAEKQLEAAAGHASCDRNFGCHQTLRVAHAVQLQPNYYVLQRPEFSKYWVPEMRIGGGNTSLFLTIPITNFVRSLTQAGSHPGRGSPIMGCTRARRERSIPSVIQFLRFRLTCS